MTVEQLEAELNALPDPSDILRKRQELDAIETQREAISMRILAARTSAVALVAADATLAADQRWLDQLTTWRRTLRDELLAIPSRIRTDRDLGKQQNLRLSIITIDRGRVSDDTGRMLETLRIGELMREAGYVEGPKIENQVVGRLPFFGSILEVERRIKNAQAERDDAQTRLKNALMTDEERAAEAAEVARRNAAPVRKTRGDGSRYDRYPDGRVVEVSA